MSRDLKIKSETWKRLAVIILRRLFYFASFPCAFFIFLDFAGSLLVVHPAATPRAATRTYFKL